METRMGCSKEWNEYLQTHVTGYDRTVIRLAEKIIELTEMKNITYPDSIGRAIKMAVESTGIISGNKEAMIIEALHIITEFWENGWLFHGFSFKDKTLYYVGNIVCNI